MPLDTLRTVLSRRPVWVVVAWVALRLAVGLASPNLTRLAAEGQSKLLGHGGGEPARGRAGAGEPGRTRRTSRRPSWRSIGPSG